MKCFSYVRFSTKSQALGRSRERQVESAKKFALEKGWKLDESLCMYDEGLSGFHAEHKTKGQLGPFLAMVKAGEIETPSALIVENLDRLSRENLLDALSQFIDIIKSGITIVTLMDRQIYTKESINDNMNQLLISITIMSRGYEESKTKQIRRKDVWNKAKEQARTDGKKITSRCVAWLKLNKETEEFEETEHADTVRRIFNLYNDGHSPDSICKIFNTEKIKTFEAKTKGWGTTTVRRILNTRSVIGEIQFTTAVSNEGGKIKYKNDGEPIKDYYPAVIDEDLFYAVQHRLKLRTKAFGRIGKMNNLFSGLAKCGYCGGNMAYGANSARGHRYYRCANAKKKLCEIDGVIGFRYSHFEEAFLQECSKLNVSDILTNVHEKEQELKLHRAKLQSFLGQINETQKKIKNLTTAIATGTGSTETTNQLLQLLNDENTELKALKQKEKK